MTPKPIPHDFQTPGLRSFISRYLSSFSKCLSNVKVSRLDQNESSPLVHVGLMRALTAMIHHLEPDSHPSSYLVYRLVSFVAYSYFCCVRCLHNQPIAKARGNILRYPSASQTSTNECSLPLFTLLCPSVLPTSLLIPSNIYPTMAPRKHHSQFLAPSTCIK
jgi:hypothetical protein